MRHHRASRHNAVSHFYESRDAARRLFCDNVQRQGSLDTVNLLLRLTEIGRFDYEHRKAKFIINIIAAEQVKDADGFTSTVDTTVASVRAYFEQKNSTERWRSMAQNNEVNALFRLRTIPEVELNNRHIIVCEGKRYNIYSVEDIRGRGMYLEILAVSEDG